MKLWQLLAFFAAAPALAACGAAHSHTAAGTAQTAVATPQPVVIPGKPTPAEETFHGCPPWGNGGEDPFINQLKNRIDQPQHSTTLTFDQIERLDWPPGIEDIPTARWSAAARARIFRNDGSPSSFVGYVSSADAAGGEPTNCGTRAGVDWHLWLGAVPHAPHTMSFIAEATGRVRAREQGFDLHAIQLLATNGNMVRVTGWLMFDSEHPEQPANRATLWEIHPITSIDVWAQGRWRRVAG